jgi:hypothetical protein
MRGMYSAHPKKVRDEAASAGLFTTDISAGRIRISKSMTFTEVLIKAVEALAFSYPLLAAQVDPRIHGNIELDLLIRKRGSTKESVEYVPYKVFRVFFSV